MVFGQYPFSFASFISFSPLKVAQPVVTEISAKTKLRTKSRPKKPLKNGSKWVKPIIYGFEVRRLNGLRWPHLETAAHTRKFRVSTCTLEFGLFSVFAIYEAENSAKFLLRPAPP